MDGPIIDLIKQYNYRTAKAWLSIEELKYHIWARKLMSKHARAGCLVRVVAGYCYISDSQGQITRNAHPGPHQSPAPFHQVMFLMRLYSDRNPIAYRAPLECDWKIWIKWIRNVNTKILCINRKLFDCWYIKTLNDGKKWWKWTTQINLSILFWQYKKSCNTINKAEVTNRVRGMVGPIINS